MPRRGSDDRHHGSDLKRERATPSPAHSNSKIARNAWGCSNTIRIAIGNGTARRIEEEKLHHDAERRRATYLLSTRRLPHPSPNTSGIPPSSSLASAVAGEKGRVRLARSLAGGNVTHRCTDAENTAHKHGASGEQAERAGESIVLSPATATSIPEQ